MYNPGTSGSLLRVAYYGRGVWELPLNVNLPPAPDFIADQTTICPGQTIHFTDMSVGSPTSWSWSFPGGTPSTSTLQNPVVTYPGSGVYSVTLTVTNSHGSNSFTQTSYINVSTSQPVPFSESFTTTITPANWTNYDFAGNGITWQQSTAAGGFGTSSESAFFDNFDYDVSNQHDELRTAQYDLSSSTHPILTFDRAYARWSGAYYDSLAVVVSTDCWANSSVIYLKGYSDLATAPDNSAAMFVPAATEWMKDTVDLISYAGQNNVSIGFQNRGHYGQAIYIDNINLLSPVGITEHTIDQSMKVYPNPNNGNFTLNFSSSTAQNFSIELYDVLGNIIYKDELNQFKGEYLHTFNDLKIDQGIYFVTIKTAKKFCTKKVVIQ
jgi:PKD repeat protein